LNCKPDAVALMHTYLDGELTKEDESHLLSHLKGCESCQKHFHELNRSITSIQHAKHIDVPNNFISSVMERLPKEKRSKKYTRWLKAHPIMTAAAMFFILLFSSVFTMWHQDEKLVVSKQDNLVVKGDTVIVPEDVTVEGDLLVKNGKLKIEGTVDGDVTLVNSTLISNGSQIDNVMASAGDVNGTMKQVDEAFEWIWFNMKKAFKGIFSLQVIHMNYIIVP